jgi:hypothetical protein
VVPDIGLTGVGALMVMLGPVGESLPPPHPENAAASRTDKEIDEYVFHIIGAPALLVPTNQDVGIDRVDDRLIALLDTKLDKVRVW